LLQACNDHSNGVKSDSVCAKLFQEAYIAMVSTGFMWFT